MRRCCLLLSVALPLLAADPPPAAPDLLDGLVHDSPFLTPAGGRAVASGEAGPFELRSIVFEGGGYSFSVYDPSTKESAWVKLKETGFPFVARSFDREHDTLVVDYQGRSLALPLAATKTMAAAPAPPPPSPPALPTQPGAPAQNAARNGAPPNVPQPGGPQNPSAGAFPGPTNISPAEAQRLQNIADEIRRRRNVGSPPVLPPSPPKN
ncbi:MAG: hypothetical protein JWQ83_907 [Lacunisphaera sp.]|nr:hypothetical protein [Lacunisphaera sp.]